MLLPQIGHDLVLSKCPTAIRTYVDQVLSDGYTIIPRSLPLSLCDDVREGFIRLSRANEEIFKPNEDDYGHYGRICNLHLVYEPLIELFRQNSAALAVMDYLFGAETVIYTTLFYERGSAQTIHRDTPLFTTRPEYKYFGVWVALEDADADNGPLVVVRRGHLIPEVDREAMARRYYDNLDDIDPLSGELWGAYQGELGRECERRGLATETLCVSKGDTIIWHPQAPHGGAPIRDLARTRFSLVMHTTPLGVPVYHQHVFFHPSKPVSDVAPWGYLSRGGRQYAEFGEIMFLERNRNYKVEDFLV
jgi:hypothetical protein